MPKIIKNGKEYSGVPIEVVTAWAPTADPVQVKEPLMGNTDISDIGDGTVTGAIDELNTGLSSLVKTATASGTTTASGALSAPVDTTLNIILSTISTGGNNYFAIPRGDSYFTCFKVSNNALVVAANETVTFEVAYVRKA